MNYSTLVQTLADYIVPTSLQTAGVPTDADFAIAVPEAIEYAELRIQRDLDLLQTRLSQYQNTGGLNLAFTAFSRNLSLNSLPNPIVVLEEVNVIVPVPEQPPLGARIPLVRVSKPYLDLVYNSPASAALPEAFAMTDAGDIVVGPWPDQNYVVEVTGTTRFTPLSATNTTNWLSIWVPDLYVTACMIRLSGWRKNYGAAVDEPQAGVTWEQQYQKQLEGADVEEARRLGQAAAWSDQKSRRSSTPARQ